MVVVVSLNFVVIGREVSPVLLSNEVCPFSLSNNLQIRPVENCGGNKTGMHQSLMSCGSVCFLGINWMDNIKGDM